MKKISPQDIPDIIGSKAKVGIGNTCAEPQTLVDSLICHLDRFKQLDIYCMILFSAKNLFKHDPGGRLKLKSFMIDRFMARGLEKGYIEYIPCRYSQIPKLFLSNILPLDVAMISVSEPNARGTCSFGVSSDFTISMAKSARIVVAEMNHQMPWVYGNNSIQVDEIDYIVESDRPLHTVSEGNLRETDRRIGEHISELIDDKATIQIGIGRISEGILSFLHSKRKLGIHSGLITDGIVDLVQKGVIDNSSKGFKNGKIVTTTMIGSRKLFDFVHKNRLVESYPSDYTHNQVILAKVHRLHAINSAIQVDLTGQVNAETIDGIQVSGVGGHTDFICGAALSKGGKSIIVSQSTSSDGKKSRIVSHLEKGAAITSLRHDVDYVVTECGVAYLKGKSLKERAKALIDIAHPKFRERLEYERRRLFP